MSNLRNDVNRLERAYRQRSGHFDRPPIVLHFAGDDSPDFAGCQVFRCTAPVNTSLPRDERGVYLARSDDEQVDAL